MKRIIYIIGVVLAVAFAAGARSVEDVPNVHVGDARRYVSNPDGVLSAQAVARLDSMLAQVWALTRAEVVVVAIDEADGGDVNDFATRLFESWGIGKSDKDNGLLILISRGDRKAVFRTGYGMEGVLPDAVCGRLIRSVMAPYFKAGDYDGGTVAAVGEVAQILSNPEATAEVMSKYENDRRVARGNGDDEDDLLGMLGAYWAIMLGAALVMVGYVVISSRKQEPSERYSRLAKLKMPMLMLGCIGLGAPFLAYLWLKRSMRKTRDSVRNCPNCGHKMHKLDEEMDNEYLTPSQDVEEQIDSVDYDVWLCDNCGEKDIIAFVNDKSQYGVCPNCGARASYLMNNRVVVKPSTMAPGRGVKVYGCRNCGKTTEVAYELPKVAVPPVIILPGGGRGGFGGGGGFSGGSFGGGMTGGGGASGGW